MTVLLFPLVLLYQGWSFHVFRGRVKAPPAAARRSRRPHPGRRSRRSRTAPAPGTIAPRDTAGRMSRRGAAHRVVIVGGGFGGLFAAKFLRRAPVQVTLIDRTNHHTFQPLLYQLATGILSEGAVAPPLREVLRKHRNVASSSPTSPASTCEAQDRDRGQAARGRRMTVPVRLADRRGRRHRLLLRPRRVRALRARHEDGGRRAGAARRASSAPSRWPSSRRTPRLRRAWLTFAVIGAGPTGVEMAGQIAELSRRALKGNFRRIDPASARVLLFDGGEEPLATFGDELSAKATKEIERTGVELRMRSRVTDVKPDAIVVQGPDGEERVACHTKVWSAGVQASPLGAMLAEATGAGTDRAGHVEVLPDCTLPGPSRGVRGRRHDVAERAPGVAEVAMQSGIHAARTIKRRLQGGDTASQAVHVPRPRQHGDDLPLPRDRQLQGHQGRRVRRLADVGVRPPHVPDRLQEPLDRAVQVAHRVRRQPAGRAHDHDAAGLRPRSSRCGSGSSRARKSLARVRRGAPADDA